MSEHEERMTECQREVERLAVAVVARFKVLAESDFDHDDLKLYGDAIDNLRLALIDLEYERVIHG